MKVLLLASVAGYAGLVGTGVAPCPCEQLSGLFGSSAACTDEVQGAAPSGVYLEARDATVWGGACHVSAQARTGGAHAAMGWAFEAGGHAGVELTGVRVAAALQGEGNLAASEVFNVGEAAPRRAALWIDAPSDDQAAAAESYIRSLGVLGEVTDVTRGDVVVALEGDSFRIAVPGLMTVEGEAMADRACCTMPESRWYPTLSRTASSVVGVPGRCSFEGGVAGLTSWSFEDENSAYVGRFGA